MLVWPNGMKYDGMWKNGRQHGEGLKTDPIDGSVKRGQWKGGNLIHLFNEVDDESMQSYF